MGQFRLFRVLLHRMILQALSILNYKNIEQAELQLSPKINCFIGSNGVGKTNLLDAVYYLSFCKSATNPIDSQIIKHNSDFLMLHGKYETDEGEFEDVYCGLKRGQKKRFKCKKKEYKRLAEHIGVIPLVMVSPADSDLIAGGSEERRRFMDMVISQFDKQYLDSLIRYNRAMQQRNALLKMECKVDESVLCSFEEIMAIEGESIYKKRTDFIGIFVPTFQRIYSQISGNKEPVRMVYMSHCQRGALLDIIQKDRVRDYAVGYSLHGIHKDELDMHLGEFLIKREGSQGQNKTYIVALKLAQFDFLKRIGRQQKPLLLLDDIFDKLDAYRVEQIVKLVSGDDYGQIFITDTNRDHLDQILCRMKQTYKIFHVDKGKVTL